MDSSKKTYTDIIDLKNKIKSLNKEYKAKKLKGKI